MPPHFPSVIHSTIKHIHHIKEVMTRPSQFNGSVCSVPVECHLCDFGHIGAFGTPCFITRGLTHFHLSIGIALCDVLSRDIVRKERWNLDGDTYTERTAFFIVPFQRL